jgi:hypothetical protein
MAKMPSPPNQPVLRTNRLSQSAEELAFSSWANPVAAEGALVIFGLQALAPRNKTNIKPLINKFLCIDIDMANFLFGKCSTICHNGGMFAHTNLFAF